MVDKLGLEVRVWGVNSVKTMVVNCGGISLCRVGGGWTLEGITSLWKRCILSGGGCSRCGGGGAFRLEGIPSLWRRRISSGGGGYSHCWGRCWICLEGAHFIQRRALNLPGTRGAFCPWSGGGTLLCCGGGYEVVSLLSSRVLNIVISGYICFGQGHNYDDGGRVVKSVVVEGVCIFYHKWAPPTSVLRARVSLLTSDIGQRSTAMWTLDCERQLAYKVSCFWRYSSQHINIHVDKHQFISIVFCCANKLCFIYSVSKIPAY